MRSCKVDSRFFLPVEMLLGCYSIAWGFFGSCWPPNQLYRVLDPLEDRGSWFFLVLVPGFILLAFALVQFAHGRDWRHRTIQFVAGVRAFSSAMLAFAWLYVVKIMLGEEGYVLMMLAPISFLFCVWSFFENEKVRYAIKHVGVHGSALQFYR